MAQGRTNGSFNSETKQKGISVEARRWGAKHFCIETKRKEIYHIKMQIQIKLGKIICTEKLDILVCLYQSSSFFFFFLLNLQHAEIPEPVVESALQQ